MSKKKKILPYEVLVKRLARQREINASYVEQMDSYRNELKYINKVLRSKSKEVIELRKQNQSLIEKISETEKTN